MNRYRVTTLWLGMVALGLWLLIAHTQITTDLGFFLPKAHDPVSTALLAASREGPGSHMMLVEITGGDLHSRLKATDHLKETLRGNPLFSNILNGPDYRTLKDLEDRLFPYRMVLSDTVPAIGAFDVPSIQQALQSRLAELASPKGRLFERLVPLDPNGNWNRFLMGSTGKALPRTFEGHWVSDDLKGALVLFETLAPAFDLERQERAVHEIESAFRQYPEAADLTAHLGGAGMIAIKANQKVTEEASWISSVNFILVFGLLLGVYRNFKTVSLTLVPLITGILAGACAVRLSYGSINAITLGFGSTLLGVAADYPNHLFMHLSPRNSTRETLGKIWPTLRLGIASNIAGFSLMLFSDFEGLQEIALFAAAGLLGAGLSTRYVLNELTPEAAQSVALTWPSTLYSVLKKRSGKVLRTVPVLFTACLVLIFLQKGQKLFNDDLASLSPVQNEQIKGDLRLQETFKVPDLRWIILIEAPALEEALQRAEDLKPRLESLQREGALEGFDLASDLIPSMRQQQLRLGRLPSFETLKASFKEALKDSPFKKDAFQAFIEDLEQLPARLPLKPEHLKGNLLYAHLEMLIHSSAAKTMILVPIRGLKDPQSIEMALQPFSQSQARLVDLGRYLSERIQNHRIETLKLTGYGILAIAFLLFWNLKSARRTFDVLSPMILATTATALIMALLFDGLNIYHLASILLVIGLSLDQALFFNLPTKDLDDALRTHLSLWVCSMSAILAFGGLTFSSIELLRAIGGTVAVGGFLASIFAGALANPKDDPR